MNDSFIGGYQRLQTLIEGDMVRPNSCFLAKLRFGSEMSSQRIHSISPPATLSSAGTAERPGSGIFIQNGEFWTLGLRASTFALKDVKGLHHIRVLLHNPGQEFHALDLLREPADADESPGSAEKAELLSNASVSVGGLGDAGEMLDQRAKSEYRNRLRDLREELEEQRSGGNEERAEEIESEIDFIVREVSRAVGLGGRDRRAGSAAERARLNVTRAIKTAIQKISEHDSALAALLDQRIRTGMFCRYVADTTAPIDWQFSFEDPVAPTPVPSPVPRYIWQSTPSLLDSEERTAFVGREAERNVLRRILAEVRAGSGRVVMIAGAPGVGKTRIAAEFAREAAQQGALILAGTCYDRDDAVPFIPFVEMFESAFAQSPPDEFRVALADEAPEIARLLPQLRRVFPDIPSPAELSPEQTRRMLLSAVIRVLIRVAAGRPLVLLADDLHWADEGTLSMLNHLARSLAKIPLLVVGIYRDNELDLSGPLAKMLDEFSRIHVLSRINLRGLPLQAVESMIQALSGREVPTELVKFIFFGTEGNPFFVEELFRHLGERGKLFDADGELRRDLAIEDIEVPQSLRLMIGRRLARLSPDTQGILSMAAVIGPSFAFELLEASSRIQADRLLDFVEEAERAGLISGVVQHGNPRFQFAHELVRQAVIEKLSAPRIQRVHLDIADAIERVYAYSLDEQVNDLAHHLWQARPVANYVKTIDYLRKAAERARLQSAQESPLSHLKNALDLVNRIPESGERETLELEVLLEYLSVVGVTNRWTTSEAGLLYERARHLCERSGQTSRLYRLLRGSAAFHLGRGEPSLTQSDARRIFELSTNSVKPEWAVSANYLLGHALCCVGKLPEAHTHLAEAIRLHDSMPTKTNPSGSAKILSLGTDGLALWMLGYPGQALFSANAAVSLAEELGNHYYIAFALTQLHELILFRREYSKALEIADKALEKASVHKFEWLQTSMEWSRDACRVLLGADHDISRVRKAFDAYFASEAQLYGPTLCTVLAECCAVLGQAELGLSMIEEAFSSMEQSDQRMTEPETWRVRGVLLQNRASISGLSDSEREASLQEAEYCYSKAMALARAQESKTWELRATASRTRLLWDSPRRAEAQKQLELVCDWFKEGLDTPDFLQAQSLLQ